MQYRNALIIMNPSSGRGRGESLARQVSELLDEAGVDSRTLRIGEDDVSEEVVRAHLAADVDLVVLCGGDGTLRSFLEPLAGTGVPVLLVPAGTSNLIAAHLRLPTRPRGLVRLLDEGRVRQLDMAYLDGEPFVLAAGFGLATDVIQDADRELKRQLGPFAYLWSLLQNLARRRVRVEMRFDDGRRVRHRAKLVLITNCAETLAQVDMVPDSAIDDGLVDVGVFTFANFWQFLRLIGLALTARWRRTREARFYRTRSVEMWLSPPMPIQIDGDVFDARSYLRIEVRPAALTVIAPEAGANQIPKDWLQEAERRLEALRTGSAQTPSEILRLFFDERAAKSIAENPVGKWAMERLTPSSRAGATPGAGDERSSADTAGDDVEAPRSSGDDDPPAGGDDASTREGARQL